MSVVRVLSANCAALSNTSLNYLQKTDFFIVGAAKCGTTILNNWLCAQNGFFLPSLKEPHYFAFSGKSPNSIGKNVDPAYARAMAFNARQYHALFFDAKPEQLRGEASPGYLYFAQAAAAIHTHNPHAKIICLLRNPADRAYAQFKHQQRDGYETARDLQTAIAAENQRQAEGWWWGFQYRSSGFYYEQVKRYYDLFPRQQIKVVLYDDLQTDPAGTFQDIVTFLGGTIDTPVNFDDRVNVASSLQTVPRSPQLAPLPQQGEALQSITASILPENWRNRLKNWLPRPTRKPARQGDQDFRRQLLAQYSADLKQTAALIQRDLGLWDE